MIRLFLLLLLVPTICSAYPISTNWQIVHNRQVIQAEQIIEKLQDYQRFHKLNNRQVALFVNACVWLRTNDVDYCSSSSKMTSLMLMRDRGHGNIVRRYLQ